MTTFPRDRSQARAAGMPTGATKRADSEPESSRLRAELAEMVMAMPPRQRALALGELRRLARPSAGQTGTVA